MHNLDSSAWITWEVQIRNRSMSKELGVPLFEVLSNRSRWLKYPELAYKTLSIIRNNKVKTLFVQNPSIVLSFLAVILKPFFGFVVIVDSHNAGIYPLEGRSKVLNFIAKFIASRADFLIVSNNYLAEVVKGWRGNPVVISDPIPDLELPATLAPQDQKPYIFFVCTWADDEPFKEVLAAAKHVDVDIYFTGNYKKIYKEKAPDLPKNVKLLGFVSEEDYVDYFHHSMAAMDLTTRENCLVCGAYEALALNKPMILSDSRVNRELFSQGFLYTQNTAKDISASISLVLHKHRELEAQIRELKIIYSARHKAVITELKEKISRKENLI